MGDDDKEFFTMKKLIAAILFKTENRTEGYLLLEYRMHLVFQPPLYYIIIITIIMFVLSVQWSQLKIECKVFPSSTVGIRITDVSRIQIVKSYLDVEWSSFWMVLNKMASYNLKTGHSGPVFKWLLKTWTKIAQRH